MTPSRLPHTLLAAGTLIWVTGCGCKCPPPPRCPTQPQPSPYATTAPPGATTPPPTPMSQPALPTPPSQAPAGNVTAGELAQLNQSLARNIAQRSPKGCEKDLAKIRSLDARYESTLVVQRAQCDMLAGRCKRGRTQLTNHFAQQTEMSVEQADRSVEVMATQYCPESKLSKREKLARAGRLLTQGAYTESRLDCAENIAKVKKLAKQVKPRNPDDRSAANWRKSLFHMGANCYARTGNCTAAWKVFQGEYPKAELKKLKPDARRKIIEQAFRSTVSRCKGATPP